MTSEIRVFKLAGPVKSGKTQGLIEIAKLAISAGKRVAHVSLEHDLQVLHQRYAGHAMPSLVVVSHPTVSLQALREQIPGGTEVLILDYQDLVGHGKWSHQAAFADALQQWAEEMNMTVFTAVQTKAD